MGKNNFGPPPKQSDVVTEFEIIAAFVADTCHDLMKRSDDPRTITGITTGFEDLDQLTNGLQRGNLIVVGGRPCMGKSTFAINLAVNAIKGKYSVALLTANMPVQQVSQRILTLETILEIDQLLRENLTIDESPKFLSGIQSICYHLKHGNPGLDLLVLDDLQSLADRVGIKQSAKGISTIICALKTMAQELGIAVVVTSQLKRALDYRADKRPVISDLYAASIIEQEADAIMFLYRDEVYNRKPDHEGLAEIIVVRQNHGEPGRVHLTFEVNSGRFNNISAFYLPERSTE